MEYWLIIAFILLVIEILTINLVSIWFCIGAIVSGIVSIFVDSITIQCVAFILASIISLLFTKPIVKKIRNPIIVRTNLDMVIGKIGIITVEVDKYSVGEVKVDGKKWSCYSDKKIIVGSKVEILSIDGVKLKVKEVEEK